MAISLRCQGNKPLETPIKIWARSNGRIKSYEPLEPVLLSCSWCGLTRCWHCRVAILVRCQGKQPLETPVKIWARSNGWIKSYGRLEPVIWSGPTRHHQRPMANSLRRQGNNPHEAPVKIQDDSTVESRVTNLLSWYSYLVLCMARPTLGGSNNNLSVTPRKTASETSCKNLSTIQRSDQELWIIWSGTRGWPNETPPSSQGDFIATPRKQASWNCCKNLSMIQRSDQEIRTYWACTLVWYLVWPDQTLVVLSSNFSATPRKTASENCCKYLSTIQHSDQELGAIWISTLVWPDEKPPASHGDFIAMTR
jgi:hypothetical protein